MNNALYKKSVIIPFFRNSSWLDEALESVFHQTEKVDEVIVVDDGSNEDIDWIEKKYHDRVTFFYQENKGAGAARNFGIRMSSGDIIFFLDSDDLWCEDKVEKQMKLFMDEKIMWVSSAYKEFGEGKNIKMKPVMPYICDEPAWEYIYNSCKISTPTVAIRRKVLDDEPFAEDMKNGQDTYLWFRLANKYKLGVVPEPLTLVRMREGSTRLRIDSHIRLRAQLWMKMTQLHKLYKPKRSMTKIGYKICYSIYKRDPSVKINIMNLLLYTIAWMIFHFDNVILEPFMKKSSNNN